MDRRSLTGLFVALLVILLVTNALAAQSIRKFSGNDDDFLSELLTLFEEDSRLTKKVAKAEIDTFAGFWLYGSLDKQQKAAVIGAANSMLKRKMTASGHFVLYLEAVKVMGESSQSKESIMNWLNSVDYLAQKNTNKYLGYLESGTLLVTEGIISKSSGVTWKSSSTNFSFEREGDVPSVSFPSLDLTAYANNDSSVIYQTSGVYYPLDQKFAGGRGRVTWERAGFPADEVYAEFNSFRIDLGNSRFRIDSVNFYRKDLFREPLQGQLVENVQYFKSAEDATYPQFFSYSNTYEIPEIFKGVDFRGGYSQRGSKLSGSGTSTEKAELVFKKDNLPFVVLKSGSFLIRPDRISSESVEMVIHLEDDSIYHPGLSMRYTESNRILTVFRGNEGLALAPFIDSYHGFDFYVEEVSWKLDGQRIVFKMLEGSGNAGEAMFESTEYFSRARYDRIQGLEQENPLNVVRRFCHSFSTREFTLEEFSRYMKFDPVQIKIYLLNLATMGFIHYDLDQDYIRVSDRLFRYVDALNKKVDYDVIQVYSEVVDQENAYLSLADLSLVINGVSQVLLSDSQQVMIYPAEKKLSIRKGRDMAFAGRIHAGLFDFYGKNFYFAYDKFEISLPVIDSLSFSVRGFELDQDGWAPLRRVETVIQDVNGNILVDRPDNKSGLASLPTYPIFQCKEYSFAYYDSKSIYDGVYPRDKFYYRLNPFTIDSLDNFKTEGLRFKGVFASAGIFPDIYDDLRVMPDYSLGLVSTATSGIKAYGGKGKFYNRISLSNEGLHGLGRLEYATSKSVSQDFTFFPDSSLARLETFEVTSTSGKPGFADARGENVDMAYYPYQDKLLASTVVKPFRLYKDFVNLAGVLTVRPSSMSGNGTMTVLDAEIDSRNFLLGHTISDADTCDFRLKATYAGYKLGEGDTEGWELMTYNYKAKIDFSKKEGEFRSNGGASVVMFTINQYMSSIDRFDWDMDSDRMQLYNEKSSNLAQVNAMPVRERVEAQPTGAEFISTHPRQDSLRFFAQSAIYSRKDNIITAKGVPFIRVADAAVFPSDGTVTIHRKAEMAPMTNAQVLANLKDKCHHFFEAAVTITGKLAYSGSAMYNYVDITGSKQPLKFTTLAVNQTLETYADGQVSDSANFRLSPHFDFYGKVSILASEKFLLFDGGTRLKHVCSRDDNQWLKFVARIDPSIVEIPVSQTPVAMNFGDLHAAIMSTSDSVRVYAAFIDKKLRGSDKSLISSHGFLVFDEPSAEYRISSREKLQDMANPGNYLSLNTKSCNSFASGRMDLGTDFGQVKMDLFGQGTLYAKDDSLQFDLSVLLDFFFSDKALEVLIADLKDDASLGGVDLRSDVFSQALMDLLGKESAVKLQEEVALYGGFNKVPTPLTRSFVLSDIQMHYDSRRRSYVTEGPISIVNIGKVPIYKSVNGRIEILRNRSDDEMTIYLELNPTLWYFFTYERGRMMALSSNEAFNIAIRDTDPEKRRLDVASGQTPYVYMLTTVRAQKAFKRKYGDVDE